MLATSECMYMFEMTGDGKKINKTHASRSRKLVWDAVGGGGGACLQKILLKNLLISLPHAFICKNFYALTFPINQRPTGTLDFPPPTEGLFEHPRLSWLLLVVEKNGKSV